MKNFIGIDLGTTNSAICSYDGTETHIWKSPGDNNDVTPSAILIDRRGNKYLGRNAYDSAPWQKDNSALLFKRLMGTNTPIQLKAVKISMTPEECSAEILKLLFGYLPEEMRNDPDVGTVITVPAAFNQMQKDATMQAAGLAGIGKIALMQEPVAAVMSVMKARKADGMFLIYDLGGGTLDVAIAESLSGRVNLLAHGGISMCGGRDFDRTILDKVVIPWLMDNFDLPDDLSANPTFETLLRVAAWATERAKIELSSKQDTAIMLPEAVMRCRDLNDNEIFLDIHFNRNTYDGLISDRIEESLEAARETLSKVGLTPHDLERIVFVGGPTNYKPLRDQVSIGLGIPGSTEVNPMTAVAEGASLFAEAIDWSSSNRARKNTRGQISSEGGLDLRFDFISRTPNMKSRIVVHLTGQVIPGAEFQIDSVDTGWMSGRLSLKDGASLDLTLSKYGENIFKIWVFDSTGGPIKLGQDKIVITRTAATIDAIPASHSIGIEALERIGGRPVLHWLIRAGDSLPKKGKISFKAAECLKAGDSDSLNFKLWEGEIEDPIYDNRFIGALRFSGKDFDSGVIPAGGTLDCNYEVMDSGNVVLDVSIPDIRGVRSGNFYSWHGGPGGIDYSSLDGRTYILEERDKTLKKLEEVSRTVTDPKTELARKKLDSAESIEPHDSDPEKAKEIHENILSARKLLAQVRKEHLKEIRQIELDRIVDFFGEHVRQNARPSEISAFENLVKTAQRAIDRNDYDFEHHIDELKGKNWDILWRQDWFVVERFKWMVNSPHLYGDRQKYNELVNLGTEHMRSDDIEKLRIIVLQILTLRIGGEDNDHEMFEVANIIRG